MPAGDPAGYLPNVMKARRRAKRYVPRSKQPAPPKGVNRAQGLRIDRARMMSGMGPRKGVRRPGTPPAKGIARPGMKIGFNQSMQNAARAISLQKIRSARGQGSPKDSLTQSRQREIQRQYAARKR